MFSARLFAVLAAIAVSSASSRGIVVAGGDGTQNTTAPADDFGFANVGQVFDLADNVYISGVYLGNGWVLSAYHGVRNGSGGFQFGSVVFSGVEYTVASDTAVRLTTPGQGPADLVLFRLSGSFPSLPSVTLANSTPLTSTPLNPSPVAMAGMGRNRAATETHWLVNTLAEPDTWTETAGTGDRTGYKYGPGATLRWGMNLVSADPVANLNDGFGITKAFRTNFDTGPLSIADEGQVAPGDSGGGVFFKNEGVWELAGIQIAANGLNGQPLETAVFGDQSFIADIATYRGEILATIPEPTTMSILAAGAVLAGMTRRRSRSCQERNSSLQTASRSGVVDRSRDTLV